jgi:hypothetical protein
VHRMDRMDRMGQDAQDGQSSDLRGEYTAGRGRRSASPGADADADADVADADAGADAEGGECVDRSSNALLSRTSLASLASRRKAGLTSAMGL